MILDFAYVSSQTEEADVGIKSWKTQNKKPWGRSLEFYIENQRRCHTRCDPWARLAGWWWFYCIERIERPERMAWCSELCRDVRHGSVGSIKKLVLAFYSFWFRKPLLSACFVLVQSRTLGVVMIMTPSFFKGEGYWYSDFSMVGKWGSKDESR